MTMSVHKNTALHSNVLGFGGGGALVAAVIAGQAVDMKPVADRISNMGWSVKIGVVGEPYGKDLSRWFG